MAKRQRQLPGMEQKRDKQIEDAGEAYQALKLKRMAATEKEVDAKQALIEIMLKKDVDVYFDREAVPPLTIVLVEGSDNVKVSVVDEDSVLEAKEPKLRKGKKQNDLPEKTEMALAIEAIRNGEQQN